MKENVIEVKEEVKVGNVILEKGDRIRILKESIKAMEWLDSLNAIYETLSSISYGFINAVDFKVNMAAKEQVLKLYVDYRVINTIQNQLISKLVSTKGVVSAIAKSDEIYITFI